MATNLLLTEQPFPTTTAKTHLETSRSVLLWNIENANRIFPFSTQDSHFSEFKPLQSPVFTTTFGQKEQKNSQQKWTVFLDLQTPVSENNNETVAVESNRSIVLSLCYHPSQGPSHVKPVRVYILFSIVGKDDKEVFKLEVETFFEKLEEHGRGSKNFIPLSQLWKNKNTYIVNNVLRIKVDLMVYGSPLVEKLGLELEECLSNAADKFVVDMRHLLNSGSDADLTIQCSGKYFLAHTLILKGRCHVFKRMLEADMKESKERVIKIDDVDPVVFEAFLEFVYTAQVDLREACVDKLMGLVQVADKYGVEELKTICFNYMAEHISLENAGEIAVLAYQHNAEENIRVKIVRFCQSNWPALAEDSAFKACVVDHSLAFF